MCTPVNSVATPLGSDTTAGHFSFCFAVLMVTKWAVLLEHLSGALRGPSAVDREAPIRFIKMGHTTKYHAAINGTLFSGVKTQNK